VDAAEGCRFSQTEAPELPDGPHPAPQRGQRRARSTRAGPGPAAARLAELPVGATEDRLAGSLDIERALTAGVAAFEPGLLAAAHRGPRRRGQLAARPPGRPAARRPR
jgi:magnesium chelatase subunit D